MGYQDDYSGVCWATSPVSESQGSEEREPALLMGAAYGWIKPETAVHSIACASKLLVGRRLARTGLWNPARQQHAEFDQTKEL